jgi:hypothetical protein
MDALQEQKVALTAQLQHAQMAVDLAIDNIKTAKEFYNEEKASMSKEDKAASMKDIRALMADHNAEEQEYKAITKALQKVLERLEAIETGKSKVIQASHI